MASEITFRQMLCLEDTVAPDVYRVLHRFRDAVAKRFGERLVEVRLFGSQARATAICESDVDILVLLKQLTWEDKREILNLAGDLFAETNLLLSPTVMDHAQFQDWRKQERALVMSIEREGIRF